MDLKQNHNKWLLEKLINLSKLSTNQEFEFALTHIHSWPLELLLEIDEKESAKEIKENEYLNIKLKIKKIWDKKLGDVVLLEGVVRSNTEPPCVRCLIPTKEAINFSFSACTIDSKFEKDLEFEELTDYYISGKEYELFYYNNLKLDLFELLHEFIFLHKKPFLIHDENCLGLCQQCGHNLNEGLCKHQKVKKN